MQVTGVKKSDFCRKTGVPNSFFNKNSGINTDTLESIFTNLEDLNPDWLLTGNGEMLRNSAKIDEKEENLQSLIHILDRTLIEKDKQIEKLIEIINSFSSTFKYKQNEI